MANLPEGFEVVSSPVISQGLPEGFEVVSSKSQQYAPDAYPIPGEIPATEAEKQAIAPEYSAGEQLGALPQTAASLATGATTGAAGYGAGSAVGAVGDLVGLLTPEEAQDLANRWASNLTYEPDNPASQQQLEAIGKTLGVLPAVMGSAPMAGVGASVKSGAARQAAASAPAMAKPVAQAAESVFKYQSPTKQAISKLIQEGSTDAETAGFKVSGQPVNPDATGLQKLLGADTANIVKDKVASETIKQGFDEGVIAAVKQASPEDKASMNRMVDIMEKGKKNKRFAEENRPTDVAGSMLMERINEVKSANRAAGKELDSVAKSLKGNDVDVSPAVNNFMSNMDDIGVTFDEGFKPNFKNSDIEGVTAAESIINKMAARMRNTKTPDAYDVHRMKKFIDEQVSYGKVGEGLTGKTEGIMKSLRRDLDSSLDSQFPEYDRVNTIYADTVGALNDFQDVAGRKMNLSGPNANKAVGTLLRRVSSNAASRIRLVDAISGIDKKASQYGKGKGKGDLLTQILFADELDAVFKPVARTSFQGQIGQAIDSGARAAQPGGLFQFAVDKAGQAAEAARGINEAGAFKSIKELLKEGQEQ